MLVAASLFSGIGGFDLAAEMMGWENAFNCDINPFSRKVLSHYWPHALNYENIKTTDFTIWRNRIDVLTGGFPCQPFSTAGKRLGNEDDRHLWPEMLRAIREIQPRWIVGENVRGLINWSNGLVYEQVQHELETEGYEVQSFLLPACAVEAPHERYRVWIVAYLSGNGYPDGHERTTRKNRSRKSRRVQQFERMGCKWTTTNAKSIRRRVLRNESETPRTSQSNKLFRRIYRVCNVTNANSKRRKTGRQWHNTTEKKLFNWAHSTHIISNATSQRQSSQEHRQIKSRFFEQTEFSNYWRNFPTQSPILSGNDGIPCQLDGITFSKWRNETIAAAGNAVVPQLVIQIFKSIQDYVNTFNSREN